jgi:hypothetical protein
MGSKAGAARAVPPLKLVLKHFSLARGLCCNPIQNTRVLWCTLRFRTGLRHARGQDLKRLKPVFLFFLPFEAWSIKNFLNLPPQPGLNGLKKALIFRVYARINTQRIIEERADSIAF